MKTEVCEKVPEVCEQVPEVCEISELQTSFSAEGVTKNVTDTNTQTSTQYIHTGIDSLNVGTLDNRYSMQSEIRSQTSFSSLFLHVTGDKANSNANRKVKLANGTQGLIDTFLKFPNRYSGAEGGSPKSGKIHQNATLGSNFEVKD